MKDLYFIKECTRHCRVDDMFKKTCIKVKFGIKRLMEDLDSGQGGEEEFE